MATFSSDTEVYETIGELCRRVLADADIGPKLNGLSTAMRFDFREPEAQIVLDCRYEKSKVDLGQVDYEVGIELAMTASDGHRLWLGTLNPVLGMASRKIKPSGNIAKAMALQSVLEPAHQIYRSLLEELHRADLLAS